jgi:hypothetical protein
MIANRTALHAGEVLLVRNADQDRSHPPTVLELLPPLTD